MPQNAFEAVRFKDLLHGHLISDVPINTQQQLEELKKRLNLLGPKYGEPFVITSGYRTLMDQARINPSRMQSRHLQGQAADISDVTGSLKNWLLGQVPLLETIGLWCEDFRSTPTWVHFQVVPPNSGKRFFIP